MSDPFVPLLQQVAVGDPLSRDQARSAFTLIMEGAVEPVHMAAFLTALKVRGEDIEEIAGAAEVMREKATRIAAPDGAVDTCGTGGDGLGTHNISTTAAIIAASAGAIVAKHGNKAVSSRSGSADLLSALGVQLDVPPKRTEEILDKVGIGFLMAPRYHGAVKHVMPVRGALAFRTIFNLLGPLTNPAGAKRQLLGVYDRRLVQPVAEVLRALGSDAAWVVHGSDGLDELTVTGPTYVAALNEGTVSSFEVSPEETGIDRHPIESLKGGTPDKNAAALKRLLADDRSPTLAGYRDVSLLNAGAALYIAGKAGDIREGVALARSALADGRAAALVVRWAELSKEGAHDGS